MGKPDCGFSWAAWFKNWSISSAFMGEETGIVCSDLKELKRVVHDGHHSLFVEYLCVTKCDKNSIVLQEGETVVVLEYK